MRKNDEVVILPAKGDGKPTYPRIEVTEEQIAELRKGWMLNALARASGYADSEDMERQRSKRITKLTCIEESQE